mgnify:CR=1 FL=1
MSLQEKVIKELGFGMGMPNEPDVAFVAIWLSKKKDGRLSPTFCAMYEEPVPDEIKVKISDVLKYYAERILESDPPVVDTAQHSVHSDAGDSSQ